MVSGMLSRHSYCFPPSLCMNSCISILDRGFLARTGVDCTVGGVCVCVCGCVGVLSDVAVMCAILSGVIAGVCMVSNETSDGMTGVCVMSDGVVCVMCRGASRVCVMSAAMMSGMCVPSAAVTGVCVASGALPGVAWDIGGDSRNSRMTLTASYLLLKF